MKSDENNYIQRLKSGKEDALDYIVDAYLPLVKGTVYTLENIDRDVVVLKFFLGYKSEEIAIKLNITKASVNNRIYRAKGKLRQKATNLNFEVI